MNALGATKRPTRAARRRVKTSSAATSRLAAAETAKKHGLRDLLRVLDALARERVFDLGLVAREALGREVH